MGGIRLQRLVLIIACLFLSACASLPIAYNNADLFVRYKVDGHFDLQGSQKTEFSTRLVRFHQWHRSHELPQYEGLLRAAERRLADGLTEDDVNLTIDAVRERYRALVRQVAHDAAPVLSTLSPTQIAHLEERFVEENRKFAKKQRIGESEEAQVKARIKWMSKQFEDWIGDLTPQQEARIAAMIKATPSLAEPRLEERKRQQQRFVALLRTQRTPDELATALQDLLENMESHRSPAFAAALREAEPRFVQLLLDMDKSLTPSQRAFAITRFGSYAADFRTLARKGRASAGHQASLESVLSW
ncbi:MAG TPA: DUF6279 family lipoprotein [Burkholderiales bacterium]|nr:DUF6279 family lipoprotein [Burkholderiales bacterium]